MRSTLVSALSLLSVAYCQNVSIPSMCSPPNSIGTDVALVTVPYPYASVMKIIGSYKNLTWSGNPDNTVTLNGSDNTVGTARVYDTAGAHVIETLLTYSSPPGGPYYENHNAAPLTIALPTGNLTAYFTLDSTLVQSTCGGKATSFNFTAVICSNNITAFLSLVHGLHTTDALTVGKFLGGQNFTTCDALNASSSSSPPATYTGGAATLGAGMMSAAVAAGVLLFV